MLWTAKMPGRLLPLGVCSQPKANWSRGLCETCELSRATQRIEEEEEKEEEAAEEEVEEEKKEEEQSGRRSRGPSPSARRAQPRFCSPGQRKPPRLFYSRA